MEPPPPPTTDREEEPLWVTNQARFNLSVARSVEALTNHGVDLFRLRRHQYHRKKARDNFFLTHKKQAYDVANRLQHENAEMDIIYVLFSLFGYFKVVF